MLDLAVSEDLKTEFFAPAVDQDMNLMKELIDTGFCNFAPQGDGLVAIRGAACPAP